MSPSCSDCVSRAQGGDEPADGAGPSCQALHAQGCASERGPDVEKQIAPARAARVGRLARGLDPVTTGQPSRHVMRRFLRDRALYALPVIDPHGNAVALLDRIYFLEFFSQLYTRELFGSRTIAELLIHRDFGNGPFITVDEDSSIDDVARLLIDAGMHHMITGFVVTSNGRYIGVANGHDLLKIITERNEAALKESEARARNIVEAAFDGVMTHDGGVVLDANLRFAHLFGYTSPAELIGKQALDVLFTAQSRELMLERIACNCAAARFEVTALRKDGTTFIGETQSCESIYLGRKVRTLAMRDLTERKREEAERARIEAHLRESQKMEALGTLAGGVAHDFNNALATILGNVELACQDIGPSHPAQISLQEIGKAGRRTQALVKQILAFGRRQTLQREVISLAPVVTEAARLLRASIPSGVTLRVTTDDDTPPVLADANQVEQVLLNLCTNAWHATEGQQRPAIIDVRLDGHLQKASSARQRTQSLVQEDRMPGRYARLTVRDNGHGMDQATLARIFEPFFTTKGVNKGVGLGLAVVHGIITGHGASIEVTSTPGLGTSFIVYFPAAQCELAIASAPPARPAPGVSTPKGRSVLFIDDDESIVFLMRRLLERKGYRVNAYTDPTEAIAAARNSRVQFDIAVTDYNMPGMSGVEVVRALAQIRPGIPIAIASGYITDELRQAAHAAGVSELIYKPNTVNDLCEAVSRLACAAVPRRGPAGAGARAYPAAEHGQRNGEEGFQRIVPAHAQFDAQPDGRGEPQ